MLVSGGVRVVKRPPKTLPSPSPTSQVLPVPRPRPLRRRRPVALGAAPSEVWGLRAMLAPRAGVVQIMWQVWRAGG